MKTKLSREKGFTLVEVLVVMAIIGVLIGVTIAGLGFAMRRSRNIARGSALTNLDRAMSSYYNDYQKYPANSVTPEELVDNDEEDDPPGLKDYIEGSWDAPPNTEMYYTSDSEQAYYLLCVSQEEGGGDLSYRCVGSGIGQEGFPTEKEQEDSCDGCGNSSTWGGDDWE